MNSQANRVIVLNADSSSVKGAMVAATVDGPMTHLATAAVDGIGSPDAWLHVRDDQPSRSQAIGDLDHAAAVAVVLDRLGRVGRDVGRLIAVGHRVVHGGTAHVTPEVATPALLDELAALIPLAPLHQPHNLAGLRAAMDAYPQVPHVVSYDTAFHATLPDVARRYAIPRQLADQGIVRYGFHGLSYEHIAGRLPELLGAKADGRVVVAHLGAGSSLCGLLERRSVATTMGFTPLDGIPMATRPGSLDPGILLHLLRSGMERRQLDDLLTFRSGLLGLSGVSGDMRDLLGSDRPEAAAAIAVFTYRVREAIGALAADIGGLDALVFTGGIGENAPQIRWDVCRTLAWMGVELDRGANAAGHSGIHRTGAVPVLVVPTDEAAVIARHAATLARSAP